MLTREELLRAVRKELRKFPSEVTLEELISYMDEEFIDNAFRSILHREPDPVGKEFYLSKLRSGSLTKEEIVFSLRYSEEGKRAGVKVLGLKKYLLYRKLSGLPILGKLISPFFSYHLPPNLKKVVPKYEETILLQRKELSRLESSFAELSSFVREKLFTSTTFIDLTPEEYVKFEEKFRGREDEVREKLGLYLPILQDVLSKFKGESIKAVDLGCGRGEWLEILRERGIDPVGVEINDIFVRRLTEKGFQVFKEDLFDFLKRAEDESFHLVTAFHVIEHVDIKRRTEFLREVLRVLKRGGVFIVETPNPRNILVGSGDFYRDPSHVIPLFPDTLQYLGEIIGFSKSQSYFIKDNESLLEIEKYRFNSLEDYISVSRDFSWIGVK